jgi:hypothetical protein
MKRNEASLLAAFQPLGLLPPLTHTSARILSLRRKAPTYLSHTSARILSLRRRSSDLRWSSLLSRAPSSAKIKLSDPHASVPATNRYHDHAHAKPSPPPCQRMQEPWAARVGVDMHRWLTRGHIRTSICNGEEGPRGSSEQAFAELDLGVRRQDGAARGAALALQQPAHCCHVAFAATYHPAGTCPAIACKVAIEVEDYGGCGCGCALSWIHCGLWRATEECHARHTQHAFPPSRTLRF